MLDQDVTPPPLGGVLPPLAAAELQDHLMVVENDLERLQRLLGAAGDSLLAHFHAASGEIRHLVHAVPEQAGQHSQPLQRAMEHMAGAITAMQFQDLASQLIQHTTCRLRSCADRLACDVLADDEGAAAVVRPPPLRPNPVTQDEMDAGSIELF